MAFFPGSFDLSNLDGSNGFTLKGSGKLDRAGSSVSDAGDINNDGIDDIIVSAPGVEIDGIALVGRSYVVFGRSNGFNNSVDLSALDGTTGFALNGIERLDRAGNSVSSAGDLNGDGIDDLIVGAENADGESRAGESYVVFGRSTSFGSSIDLSSLDGDTGFTLNGTGQISDTGNSVSSAGDVNGDGIDDLIVGAWLADVNGEASTGKSYVVFGRSTGFSSSFNLTNLDGTTGFTIDGIDNRDRFGTSVSRAGDVNGDGIDDIVIGADSGDGASGDRQNAGETYVVFGRSTGFNSSFSLSSLDGSTGFVIDGVRGNDRSGWSVDTAGDINGDGIDDIIVGGYHTPGSYVVFGRSSGFGSRMELSDLDGSNGFAIKGSIRDGQSVSSAGDINGDGIDDLISGAPLDSPNGEAFAGVSHVIFGRSTGFSSGIDLSSLDGNSGFAINGVKSRDELGMAVNNAGDINGDGIDDVIVGAPDADPNGNSYAGEAYVVFGVTGTDAVGNRATPNDDVLFSFADGEVINGDTGNDRLYGNGGEDRLYGNSGDDRMHGGDDSDWLWGGDDNDTLDGGAGDDWLYGDEGNDILLGYGEADTLEGGSGADILFGHSGADTLSGGDDNDRLYGGAEMDMLNGEDGNDKLYGGGDNDTLNGGRGNDSLNGGAGDDVLSGESGDDFLYGADGNDTLEGGSGDDVIFAQGGDDTLEGGSGSDRLYGGAGDDTLIGGGLVGSSFQVDALRGGAGADTFVLNQMYSSRGVSDYAVIYDFKKAEDTIQLSSAGNYTLQVTAGSSLPGGTAIYDDGDLVAVLTSYVAGTVDLEASYFTMVS